MEAWNREGGVLYTGYPQGYPHLLHIRASESGGKACVVATDHRDLHGITDCRLCRRLLRAGFRILTAQEADQERGIELCGLRVELRESAREPQAAQEPRRDAGTPFAPGCV